ncbi:hypothetical protein V5O48_017836 [Marasmius crinis-equi]|uniref:AB hydrolase-1 domain-containing protein n=1 Tax=Marasmius crinis-equi TaxID=585013 RepID=A0ABR3EN04_9AGAR
MWGRGLAAFINEGHLQNKRIIMVGFSARTIAMFNGLGEFLGERIPVVGLVVVEPILYDQETASPAHPQWQAASELMIKGVKAQKEIWPDQEEAKQYLVKRPPWCRWDQSVLDSYLRYGLTEFSGADGTQAIRTICLRAEEASIYDHYEDIWRAMNVMEKLSCMVPIHVVFGAKDRIMGRKVAGVHKVDTSHMVPQEKPGEFADLLSQLIRDILCGPIIKL